jgi:hypothetical protein
MQFQPQALHHDPHPPEGFLTLRLAFTQHHEVVSVTHQDTQMFASALPDTIQKAKVNVGQKR